MSLTDTKEYFDRYSKKRDLSGSLIQEEGAKKLKEWNLNTRRASDVPDKAFTESLESIDFVKVFFSCIKNVEKQITRIFENAKEMKKGKIKGKKQLTKLTKVIDFISNNFDE